MPAAYLSGNPDQRFILVTQETQFEYTVSPAMATITPWGAEQLGLDELIMDPLNDKRVRSLLNEGDWQRKFEVIQIKDNQRELTVKAGLHALHDLLFRTGMVQQAGKLVVWTRSTTKGFARCSMRATGSG
mgnify:CR=1 FL=1